MSEKEVREYARDLILDVDQRNWHVGRQTSDRLENSLSDPPDLVVLLREVRERAEKGGSRFRRTFASDTREQLRGMCAALDSLDDYICGQVCLTDDGGWEWAEDGE